MKVLRSYQPQGVLWPRLDHIPDIKLLLLRLRRHSELAWNSVWVQVVDCIPFEALRLVARQQLDWASPLEDVVSVCDGGSQAVTIASEDPQAFSFIGDGTGSALALLL